MMVSLRHRSPRSTTHPARARSCGRAVQPSPCKSPPNGLAGCDETSSANEVACFGSLQDLQHALSAVGQGQRRGRDAPRTMTCINLLSSLVGASSCHRMWWESIQFSRCKDGYIRSTATVPPARPARSLRWLGVWNVALRLPSEVSHSRLRGYRS